MNDKTIQPTLKMFLQTYLLISVHEPQPQPLSGIPLFPSLLLSAEPESLETDQIESEEKSLEARAENATGAKGKMEPERKCLTLKL